MSRQDTVSRSDSNEFIMTSVKFQPEVECLIRTTWDWLYSPDTLHLKMEIDEPQVPHAYAQNESEL